MNQKTVIIVLVVIVLAALGLWYFSSSGSSMSNMDMSTTTATTTTTATAATNQPATSATTPVAATNSFHSIFTQSGNNECTYAQVTPSSQSSSVIYISGGKMRGEFRTTTGNVEAADLMVYSGGYLYSWQEGKTVGTKSSIKSLADLPEVIPTDLTSGAVLGDSSDNVSWDCHAWDTDPTLLQIPSYVTFTTK